MLLDVKLPHKCWAEEISTTTYIPPKQEPNICNRSYQAWYGKKPNVGHLKVFGCTAQDVHIPKDERGKLDSKTEN